MIFFFDGPPVPIKVDTPGTVEVIRRTPRRVVETFAAPVDTVWRGRGAAEGRYAVRLDGRLLTTFGFRRHKYPIRGPHADRGGIGYFGAPRNGGRVHEGFDVNAACGTPVEAARGGRVVKSLFDPVLYGNLVIIRGKGNGRKYWYSHLQRTPRVAKGDRVKTGRRLGEIGATGNAASVGCHLHFEVHLRDGTPIDPEPLLHAWDEWS